jgi:tartrate dehydratase beta subunit/fumarate hydratase class I family protein
MFGVAGSFVRAPTVHNRYGSFSPTTTMRLASIAALLSLLASSAVATPLFASEEQVALAGPIKTADKWSWTDCGMSALYVVNVLLNAWLQVTPNGPSRLSPLKSPQTLLSRAKT